MGKYYKQQATTVGGIMSLDYEEMARVARAHLPKDPARFQRGAKVRAINSALRDKKVKGDWSAYRQGIKRALDHLLKNEEHDEVIRQAFSQKQIEMMVEDSSRLILRRKDPPGSG